MAEHTKEDMRSKPKASSRCPYGSFHENLQNFEHHRQSLHIRDMAVWNSRHLIISILVLCIVALAFVVSLDQASPRITDCDEITCMVNSPPKPPGVIPGIPRILEPDEIQKLQDALAQEKELEEEVDT